MVRHFYLCTLAILALGCASGEKNPALPDIEQQSQSLSKPVSLPDGRVLWGYWNILIDESHENVEIIPVRNVELHFNVVRMLEITPCGNCLKIVNITPIPPGKISADLVLTHPFPGQPKLTGFDVRGILITKADYEFPVSGRKVALGNNIPHLLNADGYTTLFNPIEFPSDSALPPALKYFPGKYTKGEGFDATLNGYKVYNEDMDRRYFPQSSASTVTAILNLPDGPMEFGYAVDASWVLVDTPINDPVADFPPEANCMEAFDIDVVFNGPLGTYAGSTVEIDAFISDWQGKNTISTVSIEAPDIFSGVQELNYSAPSGTSTWRYKGIISNELNAKIGEYPALIRVTDTNPDGNLGQIDAWQIVNIKVAQLLGEPIAKGVAFPNYQKPGGDINFRDDGSYDPDGGDIVEWEWDWENDGTFDESGDDVWHSFIEEGVHYVNLRVTDEQGQKGELEIPLEITIGEKKGWAVTWGGDRWEYCQDIAIDQQNNIYAVGSFSSITDFDPGPDTDIGYPNEGKNATGFLSKFNSEGKYVWGHRWARSCRATAVSSDGYLYLIGSFHGTTDFDPGPGEEIIVDSSGDYLSKFDLNGNFIWVKTWTNHYGDFNLTDFDILHDGSIVIGGFLYSKPVDFDPGPDEYVIQITGLGDFLMKLTSSGDFVWAKAWGGQKYDWNIEGFQQLNTDKSGNIFYLDSFSSDTGAYFDPDHDSEHYTGDDRSYLSKFNSNGKFQWVRVWDGTLLGRGFDIHPNGNIFIGGAFLNSFDFNPGPGVDMKTSNGGHDGYVIVLNQNGSYIKTYTWGGPGDEGFTDFDFNKTGEIYMTGGFHGTIDLDPGPGYDPHSTSGSSWGGFVVCMGAWGDFKWSASWGDNPQKHFMFAPFSAIDSLGNAYVTRYFEGDVDFYPGPKEEHHKAVKYYDAYLLKIPYGGKW